MKTALLPVIVAMLFSNPLWAESQNYPAEGYIECGLKFAPLGGDPDSVSLYDYQMVEGSDLEDAGFANFTATQTPDLSFEDVSRDGGVLKFKSERKAMFESAAPSWQMEFEVEMDWNNFSESIVRESARVSDTKITYKIYLNDSATPVKEGVMGPSDTYVNYSTPEEVEGIESSRVNFIFSNENFRGSWETGTTEEGGRLAVFACGYEAATTVNGDIYIQID